MAVYTAFRARTGRTTLHPGQGTVLNLNLELFYS